MTASVFLLGVGLEYVVPERAFEISINTAAVGVIWTWATIFWCQCQYNSVLGIEHHEGRHPGQADDSEDTRNWVTRHMETRICDPTLIH
jgi:L-asparagine transporter-like permease